MLQIRKLFRSFYYAGRGAVLVFKEEQNFRIQLMAALAIIVLMFVLPVKNWEKVALLLVTAFVLVLELINSIMERLVDMLKPRLHVYVESIKDIMAAAVLLASLTALAVGFIIFIPYFINFKF
ncbi:MAG: diacylglycerol kinase [Patescibacteria group bacterium]